MNFSHSCFYKLDEGAGVAVSDSLGNGPIGAVVGATTNIWANAGCFTISNSAGAAGDNAIKLQSSYIDELCRLDNHSHGAFILMLEVNQPQVPTTGTRGFFGYGDTGTNTDGAYLIQDQGQGLVYSVRGGATNFYRGPVVHDVLTASFNDVWVPFGYQIDVADGACIYSGYNGGDPARGMRIFDFDGALPRVASSGSGARICARPSGANGSAAHLWGQTKIRNVFIGRVDGEQRNNIPKWMARYAAHDFSFMTE